LGDYGVNASSYRGFGRIGMVGARSQFFGRDYQAGVPGGAYLYAGGPTDGPRQGARHMTKFGIIVAALALALAALSAPALAQGYGPGPDYDRLFNTQNDPLLHEMHRRDTYNRGYDDAYHQAEMDRMQRDYDRRKATEETDELRSRLCSLSPLDSHCR
jgi:hypothetical protein